MLASCATPSSQVPEGPREPPKPEALDPRLCTEVESTPRMPAGAGLVQAATEAERRAQALLLGWVQSVVDVAGVNEGRARLAKAECDRRR